MAAVPAPPLVASVEAAAGFAVRQGFELVPLTFAIVVMLGVGEPAQKSGFVLAAAAAVVPSL